MSNRENERVFLALTRPKFKWGMPYYYALGWILGNIWLYMAAQNLIIGILVGGVSWAVGHFLATTDPDRLKIWWVKASHGRGRAGKRHWGKSTYGQF